MRYFVDIIDQRGQKVQATIASGSHKQYYDTRKAVLVVLASEVIFSFSVDFLAYETAIW
ncbi:hypothetical protein Micbo1qcDRAFT_157800 [Microdochium bolleyi]|uniref:Uncharacterized protein n=1 Tax=Microdochium bolleyi TaxID=196109 RepID=A0A136JF06_9PEZI|nr:hypothetical protein Micbo1qcDRAFT_157800 [Microdochium bolleyi]